MHELSLMEGMLGQVARYAARQAGAVVRRVHVRIGEVAGVDAELFETAFQQLRAGTCCAEAELCVARIAARWVCERCARELTGEQALLCDSCGKPARLAAGDELMLDRIELEVTDV